MVRLVSLVSVAAGLCVLVGCGGDAPSGTEAGGCDVALDSLAGKAFVMSEAQAGQADKLNPLARMRFEDQSGKLVVKYSALSPTEMYTYHCTTKGTGDKAELYCIEKLRAKEACQAMMVHSAASCTVEKLAELSGDVLTAEDLGKAVEEAKAEDAKHRGKDTWKTYSLQNNNLANKLQGRLFVKVNAKKCRLEVSDMYITMFNGDVKEDFNPVGRNPFVKSTESYAWDHCSDPRNLVDHDEEALPADMGVLQRGRLYDAAKPVHFFYIGQNVNKAEAGCTYSVDINAQLKPGPQGVAITPAADGKLDWHVGHTFTGEPLRIGGKDAGVIQVIRKQSCGGEDKQIDVVCGAVLL